MVFISGLKMNLEKTKIVWLGKKKGSKEKLVVLQNRVWWETTFNLLGIKI
jgi:hypothetical protein